MKGWEGTDEGEIGCWEEKLGSLMDRFPCVTSLLSQVLQCHLGGGRWTSRANVTIWSWNSRTDLLPR